MRARRRCFPLGRLLRAMLPIGTVIILLALMFCADHGLGFSASDPESAAKLEHRHQGGKQSVGGSVKQKDNDAQDKQQRQSPSDQSCNAEPVTKAWSEENIEETAVSWELTEQETVALRQLGQRLQDLQYHKNEPFFVVRFLLQRRGDVDAAEQMFRDSVQWRLDNSVDSILEDYKAPQFLLDHYPIGTVLQGLDRDGDPVLISRHGASDQTGLLERFGCDFMLRHGIWNREMVMRGDWVQQYEKESGRRFTRFVNVEDSQGLKVFKTLFNKRFMHCFSQLAQLDKENYPQSVKKVFVVRVPGIFETIWNVVRRMLDPTEVERVAILSPKHYMEGLKAAMDLEILPDEVVPGIGKGKAREGFPTSFYAGPVAQE